MFLIESENNFIMKEIGFHFVEKNNLFTLNKEDLYFEKIYIFYNENLIKVKFPNKSEKFSLPLSFNQFFKKIILILTDYSFDAGEFRYMPFNQLLVKDNLELKLGNIHNLILSKLLLFRDVGISKETLYKHVWNTDKSININKLDTHLTNLKNLLLSNIKLKLNISSSNGLISLISN